MATAKKHSITTETFTLSLTREQALALVVLDHSATGLGFVRERITEIASALEVADIKLAAEQYTKWKQIGSPQFDLGEES